MRRNEEETVRVVLKWKLTGNRPSQQPIKIWMDIVEDLKKIGVRE